MSVRRWGTQMSTWSQGTHRHEAPMGEQKLGPQAGGGWAAAETPAVQPFASFPLSALSGPRGAGAEGHQAWGEVLTALHLRAPLSPAVPPGNLTHMFAAGQQVSLGVLPQPEPPPTAP